MNKRKERKKIELKNKLKVEERYYNPPFLNKWFAISSVLFFLSMAALFYDDFNDEYKIYQQEFRKLEINVAEIELLLAEAEQNVIQLTYFDSLLVIANKEFNLNRNQIDSLEFEHSIILANFNKTKSEYQIEKGFEDEYKSKYEKELTHVDEKHPLNKEIEDQYYAQNEKTTKLKNLKDDLENELNLITTTINSFKTDIVTIEDSINFYAKNVKLIEEKLKILDPTKMSFSNQIADIVRDAPGLDFLNPYYKIHQIVVPDVKYDVNFAQVPTVDRCTSCHLGISNPYYSKENLIKLGIYNEIDNTITLGDETINAQPYLAHPNLELYLSSSSPHTIEEFGCTSCHSGRGRGTSFVSTVHMPNDEEQKKEWEEKYDWEQMHYWLEPMLPTKYIEASCFKCHDSQPILEGGDKLALGLLLIDKSGCNNCHLIETFASTRKSGPPLTDVNAKFDKEWALKWINDPQSFRYNTWMPHFFNQDNNDSEDMILRNQVEIYAITEYLFGKNNIYDSGDECICVNDELPEGCNECYFDPNNNKIFDVGETYLDISSNKNEFINTPNYIGDLENGENLFNIIGCRGCHIIDDKSTDITNINHLPYDMLISEHGYETSGDTIEIMDRYNLLKYQGPNLIGLSSKTDAKWIYEWILNPTHYWEDTKMPDLRLTKQEAKDITAYLMTLESDDSFTNKNTYELDIEILDDIVEGWKLKSYSQSDVDSQIKSMSQDEKISYVGFKSINYYGCYSCHDIKGFENSKPIGAELTYVGSKDLHKFDFGHIHNEEIHSNYGWFEQKLTNPRIFDKHKIISNEDKLRMPNFYFKTEEVEAIVTALLGFSSKQISDNKNTYNLVEDKKIFEGFELIYKNNCQGCHVIEDFGGQISENYTELQLSPPNLNTQGTKVQPAWLFDFFNHPEVIRPNLNVRMPSFNFTDDEWNSIILALQYMEDNNLSFESEYIPDTTSELGQIKLNVGEWMFNTEGACNSCHIGADEDNKPNTVLSQWAPNLGDVKNRLRPDWVVEWMHNPKAIMEYTNMVPVPGLIPQYSDLDTIELSHINNQEDCEMSFMIWNSISNECMDSGLLALIDYVKINNLSEDDYTQIILEGLRDYLYLLDNSHKDLIPSFIENQKNIELEYEEEEEEW